MKSFLHLPISDLLLKTCVASIVCFSLNVQRGWTEGGTHHANRFYKDAYADAGYSTVNVTTGTKPILAQYSVGFSFAKNLFNRFFVGVSSDYRWINHYSGVNAAGNYRGKRWNTLAPIIGIYIKRFTLVLDYQFLGNYILSNATDAAASVTYSSPIGGRATILYPIGKSNHLNMGLYFEQISFSTQKLSTSTVDTSLSPKMTLLNSGIGIHYVF